jgi:hypothetical protein
MGKRNKYKGSKEITMTNAEKLKQLKDELAQCKAKDAERWERIHNQEIDLDDCFVSNRASQANISLLETKIHLLESEGCEFDILVNSVSGECVSDTVVNGKFGLCFLVKPEFQINYGKFIGMAKESTLNKKGFASVSRKFLAWAKLDSNWNVQVFKVDKYIWES